MKTTKETTITRKKNGYQKELFGRTFKIVKNGLDEEEIVSFLGGLIEHNTALVAKLEHLDSLNELAEKKVIEAQNEAKCIRLEIEQSAKRTASAIIAEAKETAERNARKRIEETERIAETIKASAEKEGNRIKAEAIQKAEELAIQIREAAEQETQNALRAKKEQLKRYYKQIHKELDDNLDNFTETTNPSTGNFPIAVQGAKQQQPHPQLAAKRTKAILRLKQLATSLHRYSLQFFNSLVRWLKKGYLFVYPILISAARQIRKAATSFRQYSMRFFNLLVRWLKNGPPFAYPILLPAVQRVRKAASRLKERLPRIRITY